MLLCLSSLKRGRAERVERQRSKCSGATRLLYSLPARSLLLTKADDFLRLPRELAAQMQSERLDTIIGHDAPGAALAYFVSRCTGFPFYATMYEPHADYML